MPASPPIAPGKAIVGLTGGIASGKSTVSRKLAELGVGIVDADQVARDVVAKGSPGLQAVIDHFGPEFLAADGSLNRERLGQHVFSHPEARAQLNGITHPRIGRLAQERLATLAKTATPYVVYDVPLLVEGGGHKRVDVVVVVAASEEAQVARVQARDGISQEQARARIAAQYPLEKKLEVADFVLHNNGTVAELEQQVLDLHQQLLARAANTP